MMGCKFGGGGGGGRGGGEKSYHVSGVDRSRLTQTARGTKFLKNAEAPKSLHGEIRSMRCLAGSILWMI